MSTGDGLVAGILTISAAFFIRAKLEELIAQLKRIADAMGKGESDGKRAS